MPPKPPDPPEVRAARPERKPSVWHPEPIPTRGIGRSTEDPRTPTLKELAARAQRASLLAERAQADATRAVPPSPRPGLLEQVDAVLQRANPAAYQRRLDAQEAARQRGTLADKVRRRAERQALIDRGRNRAAYVPGPGGSELAAASNRLARYTHDVERARLAKDVYRDPGEPGGPPLGWERLSDAPGALPPALRNPRLWRHDPSGFKAGLYRSQIDGALVVAYAGTEDGTDWTTNLTQGLGRESDQYDRAIRLAQEVRRAVPGNQAVETTGHSLGGGLAASAGTVSGIRTATFNAAGVHPNTLKPFGLARRKALGLVDNYSVPGEVLTSVQHPAVNIIAAPVGTAGRYVGQALEPERIKAALRRDPAPPFNAQPVWMYNAVGAQHQLPSPGGPAVPISTVHRHFNASVIEAMERQKAADRATISRHLDG